MSQEFEFSSRYLIGVEQIDREHSQLFALAGRVLALQLERQRLRAKALARVGDKPEAAEPGANPELDEYTRSHFHARKDLFVSVRALVECTRAHFAGEEALMAAYAYPDLEAHRRQHAELLAQVCEMELRLEVGGEPAAIALARFLWNWLVGHIENVDQRFGAFVSVNPAPADDGSAGGRQSP